MNSSILQCTAHCPMIYNVTYIYLVSMHLHIYNVILFYNLVLLSSVLQLQFINVFVLLINFLLIRVIIIVLFVLLFSSLNRLMIVETVGTKDSNFGRNTTVSYQSVSQICISLNKFQQMDTVQNMIAIIEIISISLELQGGYSLPYCY